jgi:hypothetical protein
MPGANAVQLMATEHEHAGFARRDRADLLVHLADRRALADDVADLRVLALARHELTERALGVARFGGAAHDQAQPIDVDRLHQVLVGTELDRFHRRLHVVARGHDDHRRRMRRGAHVREHFEAIGTGQPEVEQDHVGARRDAHGFGAVGGGDDVESLAGQELLEAPANGAIIIDDEDAGHSGSPYIKPRADLQVTDFASCT